MLAVWLVGGRATRERTVELLPVQIVAPPESPPPVIPPAPSAAPGGGDPGQAPVPRESAGARGRRGREGAQRSQTRSTPKPFAELAVHYDAPSSEAPGRDSDADSTSVGQALAGDGSSKFGTGGLAVPPAPRVGRSLARPPRPLGDYKSWEFTAPPQFAGAIVKVELTIDPAGAVREVRIRRSVEADIDRRAIATAKRFAFEPARNDDGEPAWSKFRWEFVIESKALR